MTFFIFNLHYLLVNIERTPCRHLILAPYEGWFSLPVESFPPIYRTPRSDGWIKNHNSRSHTPWGPACKITYHFRTSNCPRNHFIMTYSTRAFRRCIEHQNPASGSKSTKPRPGNDNSTGLPQTTPDLDQFLFNPDPKTTRIQTHQAQPNLSPTRPSPSNPAKPGSNPLKPNLRRNLLGLQPKPNPSPTWPISCMGEESPRDLDSPLPLIPLFPS